MGGADLGRASQGRFDSAFHERYGGGNKGNDQNEKDESAE
jgi:hypothetical protein